MVEGLTNRRPVLVFAHNHFCDEVLGLLRKIIEGLKVAERSQSATHFVREEQVVLSTDLEQIFPSEHFIEDRT